METAEEKKEEKVASKASIVSNNEDKNQLLKNEINPNMNILNNSNLNSNSSNNIEINKLQGFDVLEQLPKKSFNDNYNQEFYNTLDNLKFLSLSIPDEDKLFYHFEQNENASVISKCRPDTKNFYGIIYE